MNVPPSSKNSPPFGKSSSMRLWAGHCSTRTSSFAPLNIGSSRTPGAADIGADGHPVRATANRAAVLRIELPELHKEHGAGLGARGVPCAGWVADVASHRVVTVLVLEHALKDQEFLATGVRVRV